jgi:hypothetical protein
MKTKALWKVRKTGEESPGEKYSVSATDGSGREYGYADTRAEADAMAAEANRLDENYRFAAGGRANRGAK